MPITIGLDLDNTLISYDEVLRELAAPLVPESVGPESTKRTIRDSLRRLQNGEDKWQDLQARIYGPDIGRARLIPGVMDFLETCRRKSWRVCIVSHKTEFASRDTTGTHLHRAAMSWLQDQGFFAPTRGGLEKDQVYFETTRAAKISRIKMLGCRVFVDDLAELFAEKDFPEDVVKILYNPEDQSSDPDVIALPTWQTITSEVSRRFG